jgi:hypothetical protein
MDKRTNMIGTIDADRIRAKVPACPSRQTRRVMSTTALAALVAAAVGWGGNVHHMRTAQATLTSQQTAHYIPAVRIALTHESPEMVAIELPGEARPNRSTSRR